MKTSSENSGPKKISRSTAWAFVSANAAFPGVGSIGAGRRLLGYCQALLALSGMILTFVFGLRFISWHLANSDRLGDDSADPFTTLGEMWIPLRWAFLGFVLFAGAWLWSLWTSFRVLKHTPPSSTTPVPPRIHPQ
jgi:hypothetical protein